MIGCRNFVENAISFSIEFNFGKLYDTEMWTGSPSLLLPRTLVFMILVMM